MNVKNRTIAAVAAIAVSFASIAAASAAVIVPATYVQGTLTAVDTAKNTIAIDGTTYAADRTVDLQGHIGDDVAVTLMTVNGKVSAQWVEPSVGTDDTTVTE